MKRGDAEAKECLVRAPSIKMSCTFERIYFSRSTDYEIYQERFFHPYIACLPTNE